MKSCFYIFALFLCTSCNNEINVTKDVDLSSSADVLSLKAIKDSIEPASVADALTILSRKQVPVLCYHHIKNTTPGDYVVSPALFAEQMKALADSGYTTILPNELYGYLTRGASIPEKSVMLTFDDTDLEQFTVGETEMNKYNFKGVFFIMNISMGRPRYMSKEQIKQLSDDGNLVEAHTWDHHKVTDYSDADWDKQLKEAKQKLETITNKPIVYFAYPFGLWNKAAIPELQQRGIKMAFQLSAKRDSTQPLYTVRRMLVPGTWTTKGLFKAMNSTFRL